MGEHEEDPIGEEAQGNNVACWICMHFIALPFQKI